MRIRLDARPARTALATTLVALATLSLTACGPGDNAPVAARSAAPVSPAATAARNDADTSSAGVRLPSASRADVDAHASAPATDTTNASADPVQNVQASLAADSQQVTPVMSYAPGDEAQQEASTGNNTGGAATSNH
ncbi:hypothetical protein FAZ98_16815 [Paraburkholderia acidisoli]|uniref:Lipoprotein n=2 Tax=Paraburkholderia acidisoli TaxID=2571748 RepID=A0A7Z2JHV6_9BURK|nr:hypothetical protein FAZ98_16815 [Paraburkholderia acidisoli]